jgi:hypothetical protein
MIPTCRNIGKIKRQDSETSQQSIPLRKGAKRTVRSRYGSRSGVPDGNPP